MRNPMGYGVITEPGKPVVEHDTMSCFHCGRITIVPPRADPANLGGLCKVCMKLICDKCVVAGVCIPWQKQMDQEFARNEALRSYGLL